MNRKEIIEAIDLSLYSVFLGYHGNMRDTNEELCKELAEAALDALLGILPEIPVNKQDLENVSSENIMSLLMKLGKAADYYEQLLSLRKLPKP